MLRLITLNDTHTHTHTHTHTLEEGLTRRRKKGLSTEYKPFSSLIHVTYYGAEHGEIGVHVCVCGGDLL